MKLLGRYLSPYVRRVAISMNLMGLEFENDPVPVFDTPEAVKKFNPVVRIPTLLLDDGEALVESYAILDYLDEVAGEKRLTPPAGVPRRKVMKLTAIGLATIDKTVWAVYEGRFHPKEKVHRPWIEHNETQVLGGLEYLDGVARESGGWLAGGERISQADVTGTVAFSFAQTARPKLEVGDRFPALAALAAKCEAMEEFASTRG